MNQIRKYDLRVLYVEDDFDLSEELGTYIKRRVKEIYTAKDGLEALEKYKKERPDIIITDLKMPKMGGLELTKEIRKNDKITPIVITTALSDVESVMGSANLGIDKYLVKPINTKEFNEVLITMEQKILEMKGSGNNSIGLPFQEIIDIEKTTQGIIAKYIKQTTGKGPLKVKSKISSNRLFIQIIGSRTNYENTLKNLESNFSMIDYLRNSFYELKAKEMEKKIKYETGLVLEIEKIKSDTKLDIDNLEFIIKEYYIEQN